VTFRQILIIATCLLIGSVTLWASFSIGENDAKRATAERPATAIQLEKRDQEWHSKLNQDLDRLELLLDELNKELEE